MIFRYRMAAFGSISANQRRPFSSHWYARALEDFPVGTKSITSGLIAGGGDLLCQTVIEEKGSTAAKSWDRWRTLRFALLGTALVGPVCHLWYGFLARKLPGTGVARVSQRVFLDQAAFSPVFLTAWLTSFWTLEGRNVFDYSVVPDIVVANWSLWIPAQLINFRFVPIQYQVLFSNAVALLWNAYLSFTTSRNPKTSLQVQETKSDIK